ncbi:MAG: SulP family inorganic anion transporter [Sandaracinaceae bacterium]|nr:SulP family inorganic anion transporter [Sandaracinaceae bacterium]
MSSNDAREVAGEVPADGVRGLQRHWKGDLLSGLLVFLIALPLCLGIAMASGFPPVAGILTAIVGGVLSTFLGSAPLTIKGPAAGLIVIAIGAVSELGGGADGYRRALAVGVVAAGVQIVFALVRAGKLGDFFPSSVVHGMLAAIGVIIFAKQFHVMLGVDPGAGGPFHLLAAVPASLATLNPEVALIGAASLLVLFGLPLLPFRWAKRVPAPMVVLVLAVALGEHFDLTHPHTYNFQHHDYSIGPDFLVRLPGSLLDAIAFPDFSQIGSATSMKYIAMFALVGSLESLLSTKAVDMLDPDHRRSNLDRDLFAVGVGNLVAASIGGLPMISEIVRSSANVNNGAKTRFANLFHGLFLLLCVAFIPRLLQHIPLAALAAMLIYTGLRLASPRELVKTYRIGPEQLAIFVCTLGVTLATDLLVGVASGIALKIVVHLFNGLPLRAVLRPRIDEERDGDTVRLRVREAAVFCNYLGLKRRLDRIDPSVASVVLDLHGTMLVDHTVMEHLRHLVDDYARAGRSFRLEGLEQHRPLGAHELAARRKRAPPPRQEASA